MAQPRIQIEKRTDDHLRIQDRKNGDDHPYNADYERDATRCALSGSVHRDQFCFRRPLSERPKSMPRLGRGHSGRGEVECGVRDDLPEVAVGILEVSRVDAPRPVVR